MSEISYLFVALAETESSLKGIGDQFWGPTVNRWHPK